jgi:hypothetical protein
MKKILSLSNQAVVSKAAHRQTDPIELANQFAALPIEALATTEQTAAFISRSVPAMERDRLTGDGIPYVRIGRLVRYQKSTVLAFVQQNMQRSTSQGGVA